MGVPEILLQRVISISWDFVRKHTYLFGHLLDDVDVEKQERYRRMVEEEEVTIHFGYPTSDIVLPAFSIILLGDEEEINVVGDDGPDTRVMPYPVPASDDFPPQEEFYGIVYGLTDQPQFDGVDGDLVRESTRHPLPRKNLTVQRAPGDEQYERLNHPQKLYHIDRQHLSARIVVDRVNMGVFITTGNQEKTIIYHRLLRNVMRRFMGLLNTNGIQNPVFSSADVNPAEALGPTSGGSFPFQRMITISFMYEDRYIDIESVLRGWLFEVDLATKRPDGQIDLLPVVSVVSGDDIE